MQKMGNRVCWWINYWKTLLSELPFPELGSGILNKRIKMCYSLFTHIISKFRVETSYWKIISSSKCTFFLYFLWLGMCKSVSSLLKGKPYLLKVFLQAKLNSGGLWRWHLYFLKNRKHAVACGVKISEMICCRIEKTRKIKIKIMYQETYIWI